MRSRKNNQSSILLAASSILDNQSASNNNAGQSGRPSLGVSKIGGNQRVSNIVPIFEGAAGGLPTAYNDAIDSYSQDGGTPMNMVVGEKGTDDFKVDMKKGNSNILVAVRCRPLSIKEK